MTELRPLEESLKEFRSLPRAYLCVCWDPVDVGDLLYFTTEGVALNFMTARARECSWGGDDPNIDASLLEAFTGASEDDGRPVLLNVKALQPLPTVTTQKRQYLAGKSTKKTSGVAEIWVNGVE